MVPWMLLPEPPQNSNTLISLFPLVPTIDNLSKIEEILLHNIISCYSEDNSAEENEWLNHLQGADY